jgi:repressor LexA
MQVKNQELSELTPRQLQLLKAIAVFRASRCYSPTIGELADQLGISRSTTFEHLAELRAKAMLSASPGRARSLTLTEKAQELLSRNATLDADCQPETTEAIPMLGRVAAGSPIEAIEVQEQLSLQSCFGDSDRLFALEVRGDSMVDAGIHDGDYVICRRTAIAENGRLVVAILDNENATLKRFYKEPTHAKLQPANENYDPIFSRNCKIQAVVIGLVRKL